MKNHRVRRRSTADEMLDYHFEQKASHDSVCQFPWGRTRGIRGSSQKRSVK